MWRNHTIKRCFIKRINKEYLHMLILNQSAVMTENDHHEDDAGGTRPKAFTTNALPFLCVFWLATQRYHRTIHSLWMWRNQTIKRFFIKRINKEYLRMLILNQSAAAIENDYTCRFQSTYTNCIRFLFAERGWMCYNQNSFLRCIFRR